VLVFVLIVISSMTILAIGLAYRSRVEMRLSYASCQRAKAYYLALGGLQWCKALLAQTPLNPERTTRVCRFNSSAASDRERLFEQIKTYTDEPMELVYWIRDELGYLSVNKSDSGSWENLGSIRREQQACILDWIDLDSDTNLDGAELDFYERLEPPWLCKNASIIALKELLFVKNITHDRYIGRLIDSAAKIAGKVDYQLLFESDPEKGNPGLVNIFSAHGDGKVNINTASGGILSSLPGIDEQAVEAILTLRAGPDGQDRTDDDVCVENAEGISRLEGLTELQAELLQQYCCFNSDTFRIFSYAEVKGHKCFLMATVRVAENRPQILTVERLL